MVCGPATLPPLGDLLERPIQAPSLDLQNRCLILTRPPYEVWMWSLRSTVWIIKCCQLQAITIINHAHQEISTILLYSYILIPGNKGCEVKKVHVYSRLRSCSTFRTCCFGMFPSVCALSQPQSSTSINPCAPLMKLLMNFIAGFSNWFNTIYWSFNSEPRKSTLKM